MKRHIRLIAVGAASLMLLVSCGGGGDSSGRTKNSALCYATQEEKDAAIQAAQDAFDFVMLPLLEVAPVEDPGNPGFYTTTIPETSTTVVEEESPDGLEMESMGGGYRVPAVRFASGGDTSTTVEEQSESGTEELTPEQQQAKTDLETAVNMPLCDAEEATIVECTITLTGETTNLLSSDDCPDGYFSSSQGPDSNTWFLIQDGGDPSDPTAVLAQGPLDLSTLSQEQPVLIPVSYQSVSNDSDEGDQETTSPGYEFNGEFFPSAYYLHDPLDDVATVISMNSGGSCEEASFSVNWFKFDGLHFEFVGVEDAVEVDGICTYFYEGIYSDTYIHYVDAANPVMWSSNVNFIDADESEIAEGDELDTPYEYTFDTEQVRYSFEITEATDVRITANTFMSCEGRSEIVPDPEIELNEGFGSQLNYIDDADNNISDDEANCSAAEIWNLLEPGRYVLYARNDDYGNPSERGTITIQSSVELVVVERDWSQINLRTESVNPPKVFDVTIPEGGAIFVSTANSINTEAECESRNVGDNPLTFVDPYIILINKLTGKIVYSDDDGAGIGLPCLSSYLELEVEAGEYLFIATTYALAEQDGRYEDGEVARPYELEFGVSGTEIPEEVEIEESSEPVPQVDIPSPPTLPVGQMAEPGTKATVQVEEGVSTMVCDSECITELFTSIDPSVSTLEISVGTSTVEVKRNTKKAVVQVEAGSRSVNVATIANDGTATKVLAGTVQIGEPQGATVANTSESDSSFNWLILVIVGLIVVAGVGVVAARRKKTA